MVEPRLLDRVNLEPVPEDDLAVPDTIHDILDGALAEELLGSGDGCNLESIEVHERLGEALAVVTLVGVAIRVTIAVTVPVDEVGNAAIGVRGAVPTSQKSTLLIVVVVLWVVIAQLEQQILQSILLRQRQNELPCYQLAGKTTGLVDTTVVIGLEGLEVTLQGDQSGDDGIVMTLSGQVVNERLKRLEVLAAAQILPAQR